MRALTGFAALAAAVLAGAVHIVAAEQGVPPAKDTIFARKILMDTIGTTMDEVEGMLEPGGKFEAGEAREHANALHAR